jgi:hypothetical protein
LVCFVRGFSHHFVSVWPCDFFYISGAKACFVNVRSTNISVEEYKYRKELGGFWKYMLPNKVGISLGIFH